MNGIDVSKWNPIDLSKVECDFVIVKATQGISYISPKFQSQISQAESLGKLLGVYHYASSGGAVEEAKHFLKTVDKYIGKAILVLDWEGDQNPNFKSPEYALAWLRYVKNQTGITPFIYMSKSVCRQYASVWDPTFPLWCAQYKNQQPTGYQENPWTDAKGFGAWDRCEILQYSSKGQLNGYSGNLDLDKAYMSAELWKAYANGGKLVVKEELLDDILTPTLRYGDSNEYVRSWQRLLNENSYNCGDADGKFGDKTLKALLKWQQDHGIEAGYIGEKTWATVPTLN